MLPRTRADWWADKLGRNVVRDAANEAELRRLGWDVLVVWECQVRAGGEALAAGHAVVPHGFRASFKSWTLETLAGPPL